MGARQSKRSVDITTSPKKGEIDGSQPVDGRLEKIEDGDKTANGSTRAAEQEVQEVVMNGSETIVDDEEVKVDKAEKLQSASGDAAVNTSGSEVNCTKTEEQGKGSEEKEVDVSAKKDKEDKKEKEKKEKEKDKDKKDKVKKKWSFRSLGMSRKEKNKPREETSKNGNVTKEEAEPVEGTERKEATTEVAAAAAADDATSAPALADEKASNKESSAPVTNVAVGTATEQTSGSSDTSTAPLTPASTVKASPESVEINTAIPEEAANALSSGGSPVPEQTAEIKSEVPQKVEEPQEIADAVPEETVAAPPPAVEPAAPEVSTNVTEEVVSAVTPDEAPQTVLDASDTTAQSTADTAPSSEVEKQDVTQTSTDSDAPNNKSPVEE